jgi:hypothetical protein
LAFLNVLVATTVIYRKPSHPTPLMAEIIGFSFKELFKELML